MTFTAILSKQRLECINSETCGYWENKDFPFTCYHVEQDLITPLTSESEDCPNYETCMFAELGILCSEALAACSGLGCCKVDSGLQCLID